MDEYVRFVRCFEHVPRRTRVPGQHELAPRPGSTQHLRGPNLAAGQIDRLAVLETAEERALRNAQRTRRLDVEAARAQAFGKRVAVRGHPVLDVEGDDAIVATLDGVAGTQLDELDGVREPPEDAPEDGEQVDEPGRAVHRQGNFPPAQGERLQHPGQAEVVVSVVVGQEHVGQLDKPDRRAQELTLRALAAVEEDAVAPAADERARKAAARGGTGSGRAEKHNVEVHGPSVGVRRTQVRAREVRFSCGSPPAATRFPPPSAERLGRQVDHRPRLELFSGQPVSFLDSPHSCPRVTGVALGGDSPERFARSNDMALLGARTARRPRCEKGRDNEPQSEQDDREVSRSEHLFA